MSDSTVATAKVVAVLLSDGWHHVIPGSFSVGALRFGAETDHLGQLGFCFDEADANSPCHRPGVVAGPLDSILAVRQITSAVRHLGHRAREGAPA